MELKHPTSVIDFKDSLEYKGQKFIYWSLNKAEKYFNDDFNKVPYSLRILIESQLRAYEKEEISFSGLYKIISNSGDQSEDSVIFYPSRVVVQDYTGVPLLVDLATLREKVKSNGGNPTRVNPVVQTDIVVDHSIQVDYSGTQNALTLNSNREYERNKERYNILKWAETSLENIRIFPPGSGIIHQINLEYLSSLIKINDNKLIPDSVIGTDSHTTMINAMGTLGWGVGGIEAESIMLGYPLKFPLPKVVGVKLTGELGFEVNTTDLVLTLTERLRKDNVVNHFVEFFGPGLNSLSLEERATISNMAPEFGATCAYFPIDEESFNYMKKTGRSESLIELAKLYYKNQGLFYKPENRSPVYTKTIEICLNDVTTCVSGPDRPQDRIEINNLKRQFSKLLKDKYGIRSIDTHKAQSKETTLRHGSILIAAITSCTNTSNPKVMVAAGLLAKNAVKRGLSIPNYVKTSFSPGSKVVSDYLETARLTPYLDELGFHITGYGCMTCSGSSGPLDPLLEKEIAENNLIVSSILSGNRNFEGRIHKSIKSNFLASPPLVVAYAISGRIDIDLETEPLGFDNNGKPVYLHEIWPSNKEIQTLIAESISPDLFICRYENKAYESQRWRDIPKEKGELYAWNRDSTYLRKPTAFFKDINNSHSIELNDGRVLALLGDSVTTDHISPGGEIPIESPAAKYLLEMGVEPKNFNTYGSRRGNHEVMIRGTFGNVRLRNKLLDNQEGGLTKHIPSGEIMSIFDASYIYSNQNVPLIIMAGKEYGSGSSRDWAAKGTSLLGVKMVIAESFERIHRSNLIYMGVLPAKFKNGESWGSLSLDGTEKYQLNFSYDSLLDQEIHIKAKKGNGDIIEFSVIPSIDTVEEQECYRNGGILNQMVKQLLNNQASV
jgi:aconitate hydratase